MFFLDRNVDLLGLAKLRLAGNGGGTLLVRWGLW